MKCSTLFGKIASFPGKILAALKKLPEVLKKAAGFCKANGRKLLIVCAIAAGVILLVLSAVFLLRPAEEESDPPSEQTDASAEALLWPENDLTDGILPFEKGTIVSVTSGAEVVNLFYENVTREDIDAYLDASGLSFTRENPFRAVTGERIVVLTFDRDGTMSFLISKT